MESRSLRYTALLIAAALCASCSRPAPVREAAPPTAEHGQATVRYAKHFALEYHAGYRIIRVFSPWRGAKTGFTFILTPRGHKTPQLTGTEMVIETPVRHFVVTSTIYIPVLPMLGLEDTLVGVANGRLINTPSIAQRYAEGRIAEISDGSGGMMRSLNMERLLSLRPDLIMLYGTGNPAYDFHEQLHAAGIPFAINAEYMESTPLGAAEWMKFVAVFFNKDAEAERIFDGIASRYEKQAAIAHAVKTRSTVFTGIDYHGAWYMPGGDSYVARYLADAGARYLWSDDRSQGSVPLTMEAVMARARDADFWLNVGTCRSLAQLAGFDDRYRLVRAFRTKNVFNNDAKMGPGGGNDYWETGMAKPDLVLADLISIFHPELLPGHTLVWHRRLPERSAP
jgi:iron complex transport system substrate-binding protein